MVFGLLNTVLVSLLALVHSGVVFALGHFYLTADVRRGGRGVRRGGGEEKRDKCSSCF